MIFALKENVIEKPLEMWPLVHNVEYTGFMSLVKILGAERKPFGSVINLHN